MARTWPFSGKGERRIPCDHLDQIKVEPADEVAGREECLAIGAVSVHPRTPLTCGQVGCCDSSPNRHTSKHALAKEHPIVRSARPGESWCYCFPDEVMFEL